MLGWRNPSGLRRSVRDFQGICNVLLKEKTCICLGWECTSVPRELPWSLSHGLLGAPLPKQETSLSPPHLMRSWSSRQEKTKKKKAQHNRFSCVHTAACSNVLAGSCYDSAGTRSGLGLWTGSESGSSFPLCEENNACVYESGPLEISAVLLCPDSQLRVHI